MHYKLEKICLCICTYIKVLENNPARKFYESIGMGATDDVASTVHDQALSDLANEDRSEQE